MAQNVANGRKVQCSVKGLSKEMHPSPQSEVSRLLGQIRPDRPVLIAGPTASGKSALAMAVAEQQGGVIVNADASQVYDCWRVISARPSETDEQRAAHLLYGHVGARDPYSVGHWLREVMAILDAGPRPIIVGGTGLYFSALTRGLADIPAIPGDIRVRGDALDLHTMIAALDEATAARIDLANPRRVQRAWEVQAATGQGLAVWQDTTQPPALPLDHCHAIAVAADKDWLNARIRQRFDLMLDHGALDEVAAIAPEYDPALPACRAIGVPELMAHLSGKITLDAAREAAIIATRQYAKRQRTWLRRNTADWLQFDPQAR